MICLWCGMNQIYNHSWETFLFPERSKKICEDCASKFQILGEKYCQKCHRGSTRNICEDCINWNAYLVEDPLLYNRSVFQYNSFIQEIIAKWKYRGDYILGEVFQTYFLKVFLKEFNKEKENCLIVPIPLSNERLQERAFNQAEVLMGFLPGSKKEIFTRSHSEKQAKKSRKERIYSENPFHLKESVNKPVILVDDIYTTGTTLRHAASLLKKGGCPKVYSFTLIRG